MYVIKKQITVDGGLDVKIRDKTLSNIRKHNKSY